MIGDGEVLRRFERDLIRKEGGDISGNLRIVEALYREAVALGVFPPKDPLEGIEVDTRVARAVTPVWENC